MWKKVISSVLYRIKICYIIYSSYNNTNFKIGLCYNLHSFHSYKNPPLIPFQAYSQLQKAIWKNIIFDSFAIFCSWLTAASPRASDWVCCLSRVSINHSGSKKNFLRKYTFKVSQALMTTAHFDSLQFREPVNKYMIGATIPFFTKYRNIN